MQEKLKKAKKLVREGRVKIDLISRARIYFQVEGESEVHSVILDRERNRWSCDCAYFALKEKECSHILAAKIFLKKRLRK